MGIGQVLVNKRTGWADFFVFYMKNSVEGGLFRLLYEKQRVGWTNFQKSINGHARLLGTKM